MRVSHPRALVDDTGPAPSRVDVRGTTVPVEDDGTFEIDDEPWLQQFAAAYDVTVDELRVDDAEDAGGDEDESETCQVEKNDGEICGRDLPCPYHSSDGEEAGD